MGKKLQNVAAQIESKLYNLQEASALVKQTAYAKFDETVELAIRLGVDPKRADQMVRGTTILPHGTGKKVRIVVFAKGVQAGFCLGQCQEHHSRFPVPVERGDRLL